MRAVLDCVQCIGDNIQQGSMDAFRIDRNFRQIRGQPDLQDGVQLLGPPRLQLDDIADNGIEIRWLQRWFTFFGIAEHVHDQVIDFALVFLDDFPPLLQHRLVFSCKPTFNISLPLLSPCKMFLM